MNTIFSIFHITAKGLNPMLYECKSQIRYYYYKVKYLREPIKFQMWLIDERIKQNKELIKHCNELLKIFNQPVDLSKIRNIKKD